MFWIRHPQPLLSTRAVTMQVVARKTPAMRDTDLIIVEHHAAGAAIEAPPVTSEEEQGKQGKA